MRALFPCQNVSTACLPILWVADEQRYVIVPGGDDDYMRASCVSEFLQYEPPTKEDGKKWREYDIARWPSNTLCEYEKGNVLNNIREFLNVEFANEFVYTQ